MSFGRYTCTKATPMPVPQPLGALWEHEETEEIGEQENGWPGGDIITVRCKVCGWKWKEELPQ